MTRKEALEKIIEQSLGNPHNSISKYEDMLLMVRGIALHILEDSKFVVEVKIPETDKEGNCDSRCPFYRRPFKNAICQIGLSSGFYHTTKPDPNCPRYQGEKGGIT